MSQALPRLFAAAMLSLLAVRADAAPPVLHAFGDSYLLGVGASLPQYAFISQVVQGKGWGLVNAALSGSEAPDQAAAIYAFAPGAGDRSVWLLGTNDQAHFGPTPSNAETYRAAAAAEIAWLAIRNSDVATATGGRWSFSAGWSDTAVYGIGKTTVVSGGGTATASVTLNGRVLYIATIQQDGCSGSYSITVDGVDHGTFQCAAGSTIASRAIGTPYAPRLHRIDGLTRGNHAVVITALTGRVYVDWAWGNGMRTAGPYPKVWIGTPVRFTAAGYLAAGGSQVATDTYRKINLGIAKALSADGLNVIGVDNGDRWDPLADCAVDGIHPGNQGHAKLGGDFIAAMP